MAFMLTRSMLELSVNDWNKRATSITNDVLAEPKGTEKIRFPLDHFITARVNSIIDRNTRVLTTTEIEWLFVR